MEAKDNSVALRMPLKNLDSDTSGDWALPRVKSEKMAMKRYLLILICLIFVSSNLSANNSFITLKELKKILKNLGK